MLVGRVTKMKQVVLNVTLFPFDCFYCESIQWLKSFDNKGLNEILRPLIPVEYHVKRSAKKFRRIFSLL